MSDTDRTLIFELKKNINNYIFAAARISGIMGSDIADDVYLKKQYYSKMGVKLHLDKPETFSEKLQWMKLYDRNPLYTELVDKYKVKEYIAKKIGEEYVIPSIMAWDRPEDIQFEELPKQFVLKCNHDSGGLFICRDKDVLTDSDKKKALRKLNKHFKTNYFAIAREWAYRDVERKIFAEKYMEDESGSELKDYKVFVFNGEPKMIQVDYNRFVKHQRIMYNIDWTPMKETFCYKAKADVKISRPEKLDEMLSIARTLAEGLHFVRIDFYSIRDRIYFGEMTFYPEAGYGEWYPAGYDKTVGDWMRLPEKKVRIDD